MKTFSSEFAHDYGSYSFGYCNYAVLEEGDTLSSLYEKGYLPYSGSEDVWNTFYMARSARIKLNGWEPNSENRRVLRTYEGVFKRVAHSKNDFGADDDFKKFCLSYFEKHHGAHTMPQERLEHVLKEKALTTVVEYRKGGELVGYVFLAEDEQMAHVWFYFYAPEYAKSSLGMWFLLNEAHEAKQSDRKHFYIGTTYGDKSRYKMNFSDVEFWDGATWIADEKNAEIKGRIKNDDVQLVEKTDVFKRNKQNFF